MDTILTATDRLTSSMGDTPEMVRQARILAEVSGTHATDRDYDTVTVTVHTE